MASLSQDGLETCEEFLNFQRKLVGSWTAREDLESDAAANAWHQFWLDADPDALPAVVESSLSFEASSDAAESASGTIHLAVTEVDGMGVKIAGVCSVGGQPFFPSRIEAALPGTKSSSSPTKTSTCSTTASASATPAATENDASNDAASDSSSEHDNAGEWALLDLLAEQSVAAKICGLSEQQVETVRLLCNTQKPFEKDAARDAVLKAACGKAEVRATLGSEGPLPVPGPACKSLLWHCVKDVAQPNWHHYFDAEQGSLVRFQRYTRDGVRGMAVREFRLVQKAAGESELVVREHAVNARGEPVWFFGSMQAREVLFQRKN